MKLSTKLILLLSALLGITMVTSTWLRIRWTRERLERHAREKASETAVDIASDLEQHLKEDVDDDDIAERLKFELRRHQTVANIELTFDTDEDTTVNFHLNFTQEEPEIKKTPRLHRKQRPLNQARYEARRALMDHGDSLRRPGDRSGPPEWRTAERGESTRWAMLDTRPAERRPTHAFLVDLRDAKERMAQRYLDVSVPVDPEGPRRGQLTARVSLASIDSLIRTEELSSVVVTAVALLFFILIASFIAGRVVGQPVAELAQAMRSIRGGGLAQFEAPQIEQQRGDEFGQLARGFTAMIGRLSRADEEIRAFNRRLADEVRSATLDLEHKNETLGQLNRLLTETRRELGDKERLAALGQLAAQLAHEIGTPLGSVSGHLQLAMSARDASPALRERLLVATKELERVSKIVRDYLDSTRPVAPTPVACDLGRVVEEAIGIALGATERPGLVIERAIAEDAAVVQTDPGLLRQILVNLVANALDAVAGVGHIAISATVSGGAVEITVRDDGAGIPAGDMARIFEPFYTTKGRGKGTGLGLAICRELAAALGGRISVESVPRVGSTFTMRLPHKYKEAA